MCCKMATSGEEQAMGKELNIGWCEWLTARGHSKAGLEADHAGNVKEVSFVYSVSPVSAPSLAVLAIKTL